MGAIDGSFSNKAGKKSLKTDREKDAE